ncbi:MAG: extracellular solute-binding protein [Opitutaceae bacterium]|nr:extracellular solute-binding protein [Opitutaceae bacterium]
MASFVTYFFLPDSKGDRPVVHWVAHEIPVSKANVEVFYRWLEKNDYPEIEIKFDTQAKSTDPLKTIVQGVSGVANDILECYVGRVSLFQSIGLLNDLTEVAKEMGFEATMTYPGIQSALSVDGRQYAFPRNVASGFLWVNVDAFDRVGMSIPPDVWTIDEFEKIGREFVERSNQTGERQTVFFQKDLVIQERLVMVRSNGVDFFNETLTQSNLLHPEYTENYETIYRWIHDLHIVPTAAQSKELVTSTGEGLGFVSIHLFANGSYGLMRGGRWGFMFFREIGFKNLSVSEPPHDGFRNAGFNFGAPAIYEGSAEKEAAYYFMKFLASEDYNMEIVRNSDGLPPLPRYAYTEEFLRPPDHPSEWGLHERIRRIAEEIAIVRSESPFILLDTITRIEKNAFDKFVAGRASAQEALSDCAERIKKEMERNAGKSSKLALRFEKGLRDQQEIERLRKAGELVPLKLISNPFYRRYYVEKGWSSPDGSEIEK